MIQRKKLTEDQAREAMSTGEFTGSVRASAPRVAVILTQGWCGDWRAMERWLEKLPRDGTPESDSPIDIYELLYDRIAFFDEFRSFKERVFRNSLIPYVRFYRNGVFLSDSNHLEEQAFFQRFEADATTGGQ